MRDLVVQDGRRDDPVVEVAEIQLLVRRVRVLVLLICVSLSLTLVSVRVTF